LGVRTLHEAFDDYELWATDPVPRIGFGMPWFDRPTNGGIARSEIAMFMAFSSVGKTTVALNIIRNNPNIPVLFFSLEMNWRMVAARLAAIEKGTTTRAIEDQYRSGERPTWIHEVAEKYSLFVCDDTPAITLKDARDSFHRAADRLGTAPRLVVWDYLELIGGGGLLGKSEQVDRASQKLRDWTREQDCASLVLHQVGKGDGGDEPMDLGSGRYGGFAPMDFVAGAYAPRLRKGISSIELSGVRDEIWFQLLKNRSGQSEPVGVRYRLHPQTMRVTEWHTPVHSQGFQQALTGVPA
jgi:hypothetical protein